jgi:hypothetical protein
MARPFRALVTILWDQYSSYFFCSDFVFVILVAYVLSLVKKKKRVCVPRVTIDSSPEGSADSLL